MIQWCSARKKRDWCRFPRTRKNKNKRHFCCLSSIHSKIRVELWPLEPSGQRRRPTSRSLTPKPLPLSPPSSNLASVHTLSPTHTTTTSQPAIQSGPEKHTARSLGNHRSRQARFYKIQFLRGQKAPNGADTIAKDDVSVRSRTGCGIRGREWC